MTDVLNKDIDSVLTLVLEEVTYLRHRVQAGDETDGPHELHAQLLEARRCTDRVEELTSFVARIHANEQRTLALKKNDLEDAEASAMQGKTSLTDDFATAKERNAALLTRTVDQRIGVRKAERRLATVAEVLQFCRDCHKGLNDSRRDLDLRIRLITMETALER